MTNISNNDRTFIREATHTYIYIVGVWFDQFGRFRRLMSRDKTLKNLTF